MKRQFFGTDGVRGPYGGPVVNEVFAWRLGFAAAQWAGRSGEALLGRDTRASGEKLLRAVAAGLRAGGMTPADLGVAPTPAVARAVRMRRAPLGVVITASHNPAEDNGIKFFGPGGVKLTDADEVAIEQQLPAEAGEALTVDCAPIDAVKGYVAAATDLLPRGSLAGWSIVLDTANGATCGTSAAVLRALGAKVTAIGGEPDGHNINAQVGSEHPEQLAARVTETGARIGIAHDGDGDRCVLCDERGQILDGDEILAILATDMLACRGLAARTLVVTVQSNLGVDAAIMAAGGRAVRTPVGDRYVIERMRAEGSNLGGESSGHIICSDTSPTGDGLVAALKIVEVMIATGRRLSDLRRVLRKFPQRTAALRVQEKKPLETLPALSQAIATLEKQLGERGRLLVRYSGTEAKLRLLVEGPDEATVRAGLAALEAGARADLVVL
ncbi:phosphoglucosamine mutase [Horticoccus luteus]|uniref:Phosphoglucosamine mutase n=1 Tax=Horticoccus luteus TaxID=2862869 RepID=A0A8F9XHE5_9BACT|nr:phosphoglucosamine mutase [Horticoccus luteus]QYM80182.1 phosphoglucosamine mutase [Horticoccus luteus]